MADDGLTTFLILGVAAGGGLALLRSRQSGTPSRGTPLTIETPPSDGGSAPATDPSPPDPAPTPPSTGSSGKAISPVGGTVEFSKAELERVDGPEPAAGIAQLTDDVTFDSYRLTIEGPDCTSRCIRDRALWRGRTFDRSGGAERLVNATQVTVTDPFGRRRDQTLVRNDNGALLPGTYTFRVLISNNLFDERAWYSGQFRVGGDAVDTSTQVTKTPMSVGVMTIGVFTDQNTGVRAFWDGSQWRVDGERMTIDTFTPGVTNTGDDVQRCVNTLPIAQFKRALSRYRQSVSELGRKRNSIETSGARARAGKRFLEDVGLCPAQWWSARRRVAERAGEPVA